MNSVSDCEFVDGKCKRCGYVTKLKNCRRNCKVPSPGPKPGDALEEFLSSYGITKEWWSEFLDKHGLPPCHCAENQEWLNEASAAHPTIARFGVKLLAALKRKT